MNQRWLIRGLALTLLTLCVVMWVASFWGHMGVSHWGERMYSLGVNRGRCIAQRVDISWSMLNGWKLYDDRPLDWTAWDKSATMTFVGFTLVWDDMGLRVTVPMWFLSLLSALLLRFVWQKTEAAPNNSLSPVEATDKGLPCPICGHDVRDLKPNQKCPKCGTQVPRFGWRRVKQ